MKKESPYRPDGKATADTVGEYLRGDFFDHA
jgi:hypothetical protein